MLRLLKAGIVLADTIAPAIPGYSIHRLENSIVQVSLRVFSTVVAVKVIAPDGLAANSSPMMSVSIRPASRNSAF